MSNILTKDLASTVISPAVPGSPGTPGTPGSPGSPGYCVSTSTTTPAFNTTFFIDDDGVVRSLTTSLPPITTVETICYPGTAGTPPTPGTPAIEGSAAVVINDFHLGWNAGAHSIASMAADGTATFTVGTGVIGAVVGLDSGMLEFAHAAATHAFYFHDNVVSVIESGTARTGSAPYAAEDEFRIERSGSTVRYFKNATLVYTSEVPSYGTQYLTASMYSGGDVITSASMVDTLVSVDSGDLHATGAAALQPMAARGGIASSAGAALLAAVIAAGSGYVQQGGGARLAPAVALGSVGVYASGGATLAPLHVAGEGGTAPSYALGVAQLGYIGSAGLGTTSGNSLNPATSLGDSAAAWPVSGWVGSTVTIVSGTGIGQSLLIADNSGQALLFNTAWSVVPDATSHYEIRDALGNVLAFGTVTPGGSAMRPLASLGSNYFYGGGAATLAPMTTSGTVYEVVDFGDGPDVRGAMLAPGPLGAGEMLGLHDFTGQIGDAITVYVMDLITPTGTVRVPVSSWQATLQTGSSNYVQCVVPACGPWVDAINAATEFVISSSAALEGGAIEYQMTRAPAQNAQYDRGPSKYTCTLSGYSDAFAPDLDPPPAFDRELTGVRSVSSGTSNQRVRCAIDWLLRPGQRAYANGVPLVVDYINYYATGNDGYMDVGSRA